MPEPPSDRPSHHGPPPDAPEGSIRTDCGGWPFAEAKEVVAGYRVWTVRSLEEAVEWAGLLERPAALAPTQRERRLLTERAAAAVGVAGEAP